MRRRLSTDAGCARQPGGARHRRPSCARHTCAHRVDELLGDRSSSRCSSCRPAGDRSCPGKHRLLRLQPRVGLLERRGHLLPRDHPRPARRGHRVTFYEPDAFDRQTASRHPRSRLGQASCLHAGEHAMACSPCARGRGRARTWWSRPAASACSTSCSKRRWRDLQSAQQPAWSSGTSTRPRRSIAMHAQPRRSVPRAHPAVRPVLTYGGGDAGRRRYRASARGSACRFTTRSIPRRITPSQPEPRFARDLAFLGNRLPDREAGSKQFFPAAGGSSCPSSSFLLGGSGWDDKPLPPNVDYVGHVYTRDHNAFNCTPRRGAERQPRQHGALRLLPGHARVRGRRRRRLPHHRRLGSASRPSSNPAREILVARERRRGGRASSRETSTPERARAIGAGRLRRVARRAHLSRTAPTCRWSAILLERDGRVPRERRP